MDNFFIGKRQQGSSLAETDEHIGLGYEVVEPFHEILGDEIWPPLLIVGVLHDRSEHLVADGVHMLEDIFGHLNENNVVFDVFFVKFFASYSEDDVAWVDGCVLFFLYLSMEGTSTVRETWSVPVEKA